VIFPVEKLFNKIEEQRKKLLGEVGKLTHQQQNFTPAAGAWSILQVFNHLIKAETGSLTYMSKKIQGIDQVKKAGFQARIRSAGLNLFLRLPVKYKAPAVVIAGQEEIYFFENLTKQWDELSSEFEKFLDQLDTVSANKLIYRHPAVGRMNIYQAMSFFYEHVEHHKKQIERIKGHPKFPS